MKLHFRLEPVLFGIINSYSQIFFSTKKYFGLLLMAITFINPSAGLCGLLGVVISNALAYWLGFDRQKIALGLYGYNSLLVTLGVGDYFSMSWQLIVLLLLVATLTLFVSIALQGFLVKYGLPSLSMPFLIAIWTTLLAVRHFDNLTVSHKGIYALNDLYKTGGFQLLHLNEWWISLPIPESLKIYFVSLGAIYFQYSLFAGMLVALGLLIHSRIAFTLSLLGFYSAYLFYLVLGASSQEMHYTYVGFNYILTAIAIGYFLVPTRVTYQWVVFLVPMVAILNFAFMQILYYYQISVYSLPFNVIIILFIYVAKLRLYPSPLLKEVVIQQGTPERNVYSTFNYEKRFQNSYLIPFRLPFWGEWSVSQGYNGEFTHQNDWRHALDFVITNPSTGKTFVDKGLRCEDYYCYNKMVLAVYDGIVEAVFDGVADNKIGEMNMEQNWGNTIIIKHFDFFYSKICHLKAGSIKVVAGDAVRSGQMLALCGNSGRSPEPHLHFQFQGTPNIDGKTFEYPFGHFMVKQEQTTDLQSYKVPQQGQIVSNIVVNPLVKTAFQFTVGEKLRYTLKINEAETKVEWEVQLDSYNYFSLYCHKTNSRAYFYNDGNLHYFRHFEGDNNSELYYFYLANYKVLLGFYKDMIISDIVPPNLGFSKIALFFQDFVAPFYLFLKASYQINYQSVDDEMSPSQINLQAQVVSTVFAQKANTQSFDIEITTKGIERILINSNKKILEMRKT